MNLWTHLILLKTKESLTNNKSSVKRKTFSHYFQKIFQLIQLHLYVFLGYIFMVVLVVENHSFLIFSMIICLQNKKKEFIFINLWQVFIVNYFNFKNKRKVLIHQLKLLKILRKKFDYCIQMSSRSLTSQMRLS